MTRRPGCQPYQSHGVRREWHRHEKFAAGRISQLEFRLHLEVGKIAGANFLRGYINEIVFLPQA